MSQNDLPRVWGAGMPRARTLVLRHRTMRQGHSLTAGTLNVTLPPRILAKPHPCCFQNETVLNQSIHNTFWTGRRPFTGCFEPVSSVYLCFINMDCMEPVFARGFAALATTCPCPTCCHGMPWWTIQFVRGSFESIGSDETHSQPGPLNLLIVRVSLYGVYALYMFICMSTLVCVCMVGCMYVYVYVHKHIYVSKRICCKYGSIVNTYLHLWHTLKIHIYF